MKSQLTFIKAPKRPLKDPKKSLKKTSRRPQEEDLKKTSRRPQEDLKKTSERTSKRP